MVDFFVKEFQRKHKKNIYRIFNILLVFVLEFLYKEVNHTGVKVLASQVSVAGCGLHFKDPVLYGEDRDVKGPAPKIEDEDVPLGPDLLVEAVCDGGSGGLVDDTEDIQTGDGASVLCRLTLGQ